MTRFVAGIVAVAAMAVPTASAQEPAAPEPTRPVATAVMYEVNEALRFVKDKERERGTDRERLRDRRASAAEVARRLAKASLLGNKVKPVEDGGIFKAGSFIQADATSNVNLSNGQGPIHGKLRLLTDTDPNRESLDTLVVDTEAFIRGELDLSTAMQGFAGLTGRFWTLKKLEAGTFQGLFLIPFQVEGDDRYFYLDIAGPAEPCEKPEYVKIGDQPIPACPLESFEFALGIPLTKAVVTFFQ